MPDETLPFPVAMRGYDREAVAAHIARLEDAVKEAQSAAQQAQDDAAQTRAHLDEAQRSLREADKPTYKGLGARVEQLLRSAEEQSSDVVQRANTHAQDTVARANVARDGTMVAPSTYLEVVVTKH